MNNYRIVEFTSANGDREYVVEYRLSEKFAFNWIGSFGSLRAAKRWIKEQEGFRLVGRRVVWP